jgi:BirA family biotin operon repressor/biotin-[acetyl-CoA-carboxylase] ligase
MSPIGLDATAPASPERLRALARAWRTAFAPGEPGRPELLLASTIDSTQRWARTLLETCLADEDELGPFACGALEQWAGRGRDRRRWESPPGGIYATLVLPVADATALQALPAKAAIGLARAVNPILGGTCRIKWPNDLVVARRKLGGVLVDVLTPASGTPWALVGFGLNHSQADLGNATGVATSLAAEVGLELPFFEELFAGVVASVSRSVGSANGWLESYRALSAHTAGDPIRARLPDRTIDGRFAGFDENGFLRIESRDGSEVLRTGEVFSW